MNTLSLIYKQKSCSSSCAPRLASFQVISTWTVRWFSQRRLVLCGTYRSHWWYNSQGGEKKQTQIWIPQKQWVYFQNLFAKANSQGRLLNFNQVQKKCDLLTLKYWLLQLVGNQLGESWRWIKLHHESTWQPRSNEQKNISASVGYCN